MHFLGISPELLTRTINERHQGLASDGLDRILAVRWLNSETAILVDSIVTKYEDDPDQNLRKILQVAPQLAIRLANVLPAGSIRPESPISELLPIVAESFGLKVSCHPDEDAAWVYEGAWDGNTVRLFGSTTGSPVYVAGSCYSDLKKCELVWSLDRQKYCAWFAENLASSVQASKPFQTPLELVNAQKRLLEALFPEGWFVNVPKKRLEHPAYVRWRRCEVLLAQDGRVQLPRDVEIVNTLLIALLDNLSIIQATRGSVDAQELGDLANYGDEAVQKRLRAVIQHPEQFLDALVEVTCAGWHVSRGHDVKATEKDGMPDLDLQIPGWELPIQAECKCVKYAGFKKAIEKANAQIKRAAKRCYGLVYLDVSQRNVDPASFWSDSLPKEFATIQAELQHCLERFNRSVSGVILLWKDHTILRMNDGGVLCFLRYRGILIRHKGPLERLPEDTEPIMVGYTCMLPVVPDQGS